MFKVLPSDDLILSLTVPELAWIHTMILQDDREAYEEKLDFVEYLASFSAPEAVRKLRGDRKNTKAVTDDEFAHLLEKNFGREAPVFQERQ